MHNAPVSGLRRCRLPRSWTRRTSPASPSTTPRLGMLDQKDMTDAANAALRSEDGSIRSEFVEQVQDAITNADGQALRRLVGDLHESDVGDLIEALDAESRPKLVALLGRDFDFTALTEVDDVVREEILE